MIDDLMSLVVWLFVLASGPAALYLGLLTLLSRRISAPDGNQTWRFAVVVPAHNEAAQIAETVASLQSVDYPKDRYRVVVVADNCTDATGAVAAAAGAEVLVRQHETERGKGYALHHAFEILLGRTGPEMIDAVVVVDADSVVSPNLLTAFAARLSANEIAVQADYGVRNPLASWRTRLMTVALAIFHRVRGLGRERMHLSAGLRGNGMCFSRACLSRFPHDAHGLVEDVEYGIALGLGGARIAYADEAQVLGEMVSGGQASESQRARWESGRALLKKHQLPKLLLAAWKRRSLMLLDLAMDLWVPPLAKIGGLMACGWCAEAARLGLSGNVQPSTYVLLVTTAALVAYVGRGVVLSGLGLGAVSALMWAPVYVGWKVVLKVVPRQKNQGWVRTQREKTQPPDRS